MDKDAALATISSLSVVAGLFAALLLTRLESWRASASAAAASVRAVRTGVFNDRDAVLHAELHCWEVLDDVPKTSSILIDAVLLLGAVASYVTAASVPELAPSSPWLSAPAVALLLLLLLAQWLFIRNGLSTLKRVPYATFTAHP